MLYYVCKLAYISELGLGVKGFVVVVYICYSVQCD